MKISRKVHLWLADRYPAFDTPSIYRRPPVQALRGPSGWDRILMAVVGVPLFLIGLFGTMLGFFLMAVFVMVIFGY